MNSGAKKWRKIFEIIIYSIKLKQYERLENIDIAVMENWPSQGFIAHFGFLSSACIYKFRFILQENSHIWEIQHTLL